MKRIFTSLALICLAASVVMAQEQPNPPKNINPISKTRVLHVDSAVVTKHTVTIRGKVIPYTATTGCMPVWDKDGRPVAGVFYTYYKRDDITDRSNRPLVISFNGGPGTPSVWMEIGYTGPRRLNIDDEGYPIQPFGMKDNPNSILDIADIVYVDPVNTGYSRIVSDSAPRSDFFGVNEDIKYLADWINTFVTREDRWASPKFLIGESYGTTRVSGLALALQNSEWMYLDGVILVSPTDLGINRSGPVQEALRLPYFAAAAWYHKTLAPEYQNKALTDFLPEVEQFTINQLIPAMSRGGFIDSLQRNEMAAKMSAYCGIPQNVILQNNLDVSYDLFWKELLRGKGYTIGRLDSRYKGVDRKAYGDSPDYNAELTAWLQAFTPAMNIYLRNELNYKTDLKYQMFGNVWPWDDKDDQTGENLRQALAQNPYLHLLVQSGYFDGGCDYFNAKYSLWQLDPSGRLKSRIKWEGYPSGHMIYLRKEVIGAASDSLRHFILQSIPKPGAPAKY